MEFILVSLTALRNKPSNVLHLVEFSFPPQKSSTIWSFITSEKRYKFVHLYKTWILIHRHIYDEVLSQNSGRFVSYMRLGSNIFGQRGLTPITSGWCHTYMGVSWTLFELKLRWGIIQLLFFLFFDIISQKSFKYYWWIIVVKWIFNPWIFTNITNTSLDVFKPIRGGTCTSGRDGYIMGLTNTSV